MSEVTVPHHIPTVTSHTVFHTHQQPKFKTLWVTAEEGEEEGYGGWRATAAALRKPLPWPGAQPPWHLHRNPPYFPTLLGTPRGGSVAGPGSAAIHRRIHCKALGSAAGLPTCHRASHLLLWPGPPGVQLTPQRSLPRPNPSTSLWGSTDGDKTEQHESSMLLSDPGRAQRDPEISNRKYSPQIQGPKQTHKEGRRRDRQRWVKKLQAAHFQEAQVEGTRDSGRALWAGHPEGDSGILRAQQVRTPAGHSQGHGAHASGSLPRFQSPEPAPLALKETLPSIAETTASSGPSLPLEQEQQ